MKKKQIVRQKFRDETFLRDGRCCCCCFCDITVDLDAHHITDRTLMPNGGYVRENGITVCQQHHLDAEQFHISGGTTWIDSMHPNDLYNMINSSLELAIIKSEKL